MINQQTIVLNADYSFLNTVNVKKAICLIMKGKAEVVKDGKKILTNFEKSIRMAVPKVIRLIKIVRMAFRKGVPWSKRNVFTRDEFTCQYCNTKFKKKSKSLTIDHVVPKSKGGKTSWVNCVCACRNCNSNKDNRTPNEIGLTLLKKPVKPTIGEFIQLKAKQYGLDKILDDIFKEMV